MLRYEISKAIFIRDTSGLLARRGGKRALIAIVHTMLAIYHVLKDGAEYYNQFNKERKIKTYLKKLKALGWEDLEAMIEQPA